jgi:hypothetical protein
LVGDGVDEINPFSQKEALARQDEITANAPHCLATSNVRDITQR